ncbi:elongation factor Ts [Caulobacter sp. Root655]|uniref:translation elongation factor Ts n=1 Tax=Caulobacter sp. Root655 TaxID=1736578 RepID=UPI0006F9DE1D|nr:translation elongation factor Ts [Caulobacter sp. Root655]KRA65170.1 elongation factor Ts [Caulobacter sp. Root655]
MAEVTAALVKELREKSGVGMMDCKKALVENAGDIDASIDWLRAKGLSKAAKKADRIAAEGLVGIAVRNDGAGMTAAAVEVNAETDFLGRNELFQNAVRKIAAVGLDVEGVEAINAAKTADGDVVSDVLTNLIATIGENMVLRRSARFTVAKGAVSSYIHNATAPDLGRIGVLVAIEGEGDQAKILELGRKIAMHVAATAPLSLSPDDLDQAAIEKERQIFTEQALESGKPPAVVEKMVEGRIRKFLEEVVLLKQAFVMNPDQTVEQLVAETGKELGSPLTVKGFVRLALGEGVEKGPEGDFAAEVAAMTGGQA